MRSLALLVLFLAPFAPASPAQPQQSFQHRWGGLVFDAFMSADGQHLWTVEDGGRIRYRNSGPPVTWTYQTVPDMVKDTLHRVHFLADNMTGWAVGQDGWVLKTTDGGVTWSALFQKQTPYTGGGTAELYDVHFLDDVTGWLVGTKDVWYTTTGGMTDSDWISAPLVMPTGGHVNLDKLELYAIDVVQRAEGILALVSGEPGYVFRNGDALGTGFGLTWMIQDACPQLQLTCERYACSDVNPAVFEPWDVEISRHPTNSLALVAGGIGGVQCGLVMASHDDGLTWFREPHECTVPGHNCDMNPLYEQTTPQSTWRHTSFRTLYGVAILDGDNSAVAAGYNGQHVVRNPTTGIWEDRSSFSSDPINAVNAVVFPLYGAAAGSGTATQGNATLTGAGGHIRKSSASATSWSDDWMGEPWRIADVHFIDSMNGWQVGQFFRVAKTTNGGQTWDEQDPQPQLRTPSLTAIVFEPSGVRGVTVGEKDSGSLMYPNKPKVLWTDTGGSAPGWLEPGTISIASGTDWDDKTLHDVEWIGGSGEDTAFCAVGQAGLIFRTDDSGLTWHQVVDPVIGLASLQSHELFGVDFYDADHGVIVGRKNGGGARAYSYARNGTTETLVDITPADLSISVLADVQVLGIMAYAVGERSVSGVRTGVIVSAQFGGGSFGQFTDVQPQPPLFTACGVGGALGVNPVLMELAVDHASQDIWVGGECGRIWRRMNPGGWSELKSQTDAHIRGLSLTPGGSLFLAGFRATPTQQVITVR